MNRQPRTTYVKFIHCLVLCAGLLILAASKNSGVRAAAMYPRRAAQPSEALASLPLLSQSDLAYLGAFHVPHQDNLGNSLGYSGHALGIDPSRNGLFFGGHDWYQLLCEIGIPEGIDLNQTAPILQDCTDVTEGNLDRIDVEGIKLGGTLVYDGRLIVSAYSYYDADGSQTLSHFVSGLDLSASGDIQGPYQVGDWAGIVSGYMTTTPLDWQAALGGPALTGNCCLPIVSRTSYGPAVSVFDPDQVSSLEPAPAVPLLYYPSDHPLADWDATSLYFNGSTHIVGVAFPAGTRSVFFFGRQGTGQFCYGTGEECNDPADSSKGTHAYPYIHQVWAYDALDLQAVKDGEKQPWEVQPYALWHLTEMDASGSATIAGAAHDPLSGRVYLTERFGEEPAVHVYQITVPARPGPGNPLYFPLIAR
jgi:hypothetical protein